MTNDDFKDIRILDNFYQTSSFYPMPVVHITTFSETGAINIGPYSLVFPFGIAGKHAMMLISRDTSNTAVNITRTKRATLNFLPYNKRYLKNTVRLGFPGQTSEEKLDESIFTLVPSNTTTTNGKFPDHIAEAIQYFECTWENGQDFQYNGSEGEGHFLLRIDRICLKEEWHSAIIEGNGRFPVLPIDYGYRDNSHFFFSKPKSPYAEPLPRGKGVDIGTVRYQADRLDPTVYWTDEACEKIVAIPRVFLKKAMEQIVEQAKEMSVTTLTPEILDQIRDKRNKEKR